jgi:inhibitor of KinA sporulation pathway (predicted exonuclease)
MNLNEIIDAQTNLTVIDVESTCWKDKSEQGDKPNEVIEIGICKIIKGELVRVPSIMIKPKFSEVSQFCTQLTTITPEQASKGLDPKEAYSKLRDAFVSNTWASWGFYDQKILTKMFELHKLPNVLPKNHINVRAFMSKKVFKSDDPFKAPGTIKSMKHLGMDFEGTNHRGDDDAYNIARIYLELIKMKDD